MALLSLLMAKTGLLWGLLDPPSDTEKLPSSFERKGGNEDDVCDDVNTMDKRQIF